MPMLPLHLKALASATSRTVEAERMERGSPVDHTLRSGVVENQVHPPETLGTAAKRTLEGPRVWKEEVRRGWGEVPRVTVKFREDRRREGAR